MDVLRGRLLKRLREADRYRRLRVYCPIVNGLGNSCMSVHSKLLVADERLVRVGSANLNNRSMGLDTECDLAIEADGNEKIEREIGRFRDSLIAEHLGVRLEKFRSHLKEQESLAKAIDSLRGNRERTLEPVDGAVGEWLDQTIPDSAIVDPEAPVAPEKLIEELVPPEERRSTRGTLIRVISIVFFFFAIAATWRWTSWGQSIDVAAIADWVRLFRESGVAPLIVLSAYVVGGLLVFPMTLLIVATAFAFGPWPALIYSLLGCLSSAILVYGLGYGMGRQAVARWVGSRLNRLNRLLTRHGVFAVATIRLLPLAPYSVVNLVAGAVRVRFRDFVLGTLLGISPGVIGITLFETQLENVVRDPGLQSLTLLAAILAFLLLGVVWLRRRLSEEQRPSQAGSSSP